MSKFNKNMSYDRAREKAMRYCSFQERCTLDLEKRFYAWNVKKGDWDKILGYLIKEDFLNEKRYVEAFVRGKFKIKKWGKNKLKMGLIAKRIYDEKQFNQVFEEEIEEEEYVNTIKELIVKKTLITDEEDEIKLKARVYKYMLSKGFESDLVYKELNII